MEATFDNSNPEYKQKVIFDLKILAFKTFVKE